MAMNLEQAVGESRAPEGADETACAEEAALVQARADALGNRVFAIGENKGRELGDCKGHPWGGAGRVGSAQQVPG